MINISEVSEQDLNVIATNRAFDMPAQSSLDPGQIRWQLDTDDILLRLSSDLLRCNVNSKGELIPIMLQAPVREDDGQVVMKEFPLRPLVNHIGLVDIKTILSPYLNKNMYLSEYDTFEIASKVKLSLLSLIGTIYSNHDKYGLEIGDADMIVNLCMNYMLDAAKRSEDGGERKFITTAAKIVEHKLTRMDDVNKDKKGVLDWFRQK